MRISHQNSCGAYLDAGYCTVCASACADASVVVIAVGEKIVMSRKVKGSVFTLMIAFGIGDGVFAAPHGSEDGLVSNFETGDISTKFGAGWAESTDSIVGGESTVFAQVIAPGAEGSAGALRLKGQLQPGPANPFAGYMFSPGTAPYPAPK